MRRHELTDQQWELLAPFFPPRPRKRGGQWKDDRTMLNGIFWVLRTGAPWRDLPERYGPYTTASLQSLAQGRHLEPPDGRHRQSVRRQGADDRQLDRARSSACLGCQKKCGDRCVGRSRGGFTTKIQQG